MPDAHKRRAPTFDGAVVAAGPNARAFRQPRAVSPREVEADAPLDHPHLYFNRELSWLDFNWRVLHQAADTRIPVLERVRYLAITQSNLDEFFAKRVGGLKRQKQAGVTQLSPDGRTPDEQLTLIRAAALQMQDAMGETWAQSVQPELERHAGIRIVPYRDLGEAQRDLVHEVFRETIYPILTPLAVDPSHPFPFISNLSHSLAVVLRHPLHASLHFARVKIPPRRARWIPLKEPLHFIALEDVVRAHIDELFPGMTVAGTYLFRVTRNADVARYEEEASDLVEMISEELRQRRFAPVVRLEAESSTPESVSSLLRRELELQQEDEYCINGLQDLSGLAGLANLDLPQHRFEGWDPVVPGPLAAEGRETGDVFALLRKGDILVHHPYDSFTGTVERFLESAAEDARVLAIKQTVYRTSEDSPVVRTLMKAAEKGKQVAVLVEVTARFDEERNISWAEQLEDSGAHVIYGVPGLKTHAKVTLVVREEEDGLRTYCHIGTGNYHPTTARLYTDMGLLTAEPAIGRDIVELFHSVTGYAPTPSYRTLIVAPLAMRQSFEALIEREIEIQEAGGSGRIIAKMNAIDDTDMIRALYEASRAGVSIDLIVRGHSRLRPGLTGVSENIRVTSVVGRFLEHDRIYSFGNGGAPRIFMGSADWRRRNLEERVEAVVEVTGHEERERVSRILDTIMRDNTTAWDLDANGVYQLRQPKDGEPVISCQHEFMADAVRRRHAFDEAAALTQHG
ncbi:MAG: polyphosphate kinase 1 [Gemmatimonadetes bacterium]|nr:polyphosphate kinase 1 [Gemmatimonadota bacterium]